VLACGIVACAGVAGGCGLERNGLGETTVDGSAMTSSTPVGDASASLPDGSSAAPPPDEDGSGPGADATIAGDATSPPDAPQPLDDANIPDVGQPDVHVLDPDGSYDDSGDPCDLDQDGYKAMGGSCGGNDCCDYDSRANPGDTSFYAAADACGSFDYDCNGKDDPEYGRVNCTLGFFVCNGDGFDQTIPACGVAATFDTCNDAVVTCTTSQSQAPQGCR
jgi:hypothetical protein